MPPLSRDGMVSNAMVLLPIFHPILLPTGRAFSSTGGRTFHQQVSHPAFWGRLGGKDNWDSTGDFVGYGPWIWKRTLAA